MGLANKLIVPFNWEYQNAEVVEIELRPSSREYERVYGTIHECIRSKVSSIKRIQNPYLYHRYMIKKAEYTARKICFKEQDLFHATAKTKVASIIKDNLDWRLVRRCKFGKGVSFSDCARYANQECSRYNGFERAMLICKVLIGNTCNGHGFMEIPPKQCDTSIGNNCVFVKYYDDEFYPQYAAYYSLI